MSIRKRDQLRLESLEQRALLAGDVLASVAAGNLRLVGDALANEIAVVDLGGGKFEISGRPGTTINGKATPLTLLDITLGVKADMLGGKDVVDYTGLAGTATTSPHLVPKISIQTGDGDDTVSVDKVFAGQVSIDTGAGNDTVKVMDLKAASLEVETGAGDDVVNFGDTKLRPTTTVTVGELEVETGDGNDKVGFQGVVLKAGETEIETGGGDDVVTIDGLNSKGQFEINTWAGKDAVTIANSDFTSLKVDLGSGDDSLDISKTKSLRTRLDGGAGSDKLTVADSTLGNLRTEGFEITGPTPV